MRNLALLALLLAGCGAHPEEPLAPSSKVSVLLFAAGKEDSLLGTNMIPVGPELTAAGFNVVTFDLPCHGSDATKEPPLNCWRTRIEGGDRRMFVNFCAKVSAAITQLEVPTIAAVGISRGGYVAIRCAALDSRITALGLIAPVTDLQRLEEFNGYTVDQETFGVFKYRGQLSNLPTLLRMNRTDPRVGTDSALAFVQSFTSLTTQILDATGHGIPESTETAAWLRTL